MDWTRRTRRNVRRSTGNIVAASALAPFFARRVEAAATPITVGFIYAATRQDYGWNQAHAVAARKIAQIEGVKLVEQEKVPETAEVEKVMESMIRLDNCKVLFPTSFGFWRAIVRKRTGTSGLFTWGTMRSLSPSAREPSLAITRRR
jgi:simple sugar transport system substrate-binding protein